MKSSVGITLLLRWVIANALGEMIGLGLTLLVGVVIISRLGDQLGTQIILVSFMVAVFSGVFEATIVGLAQWWAMHPWFPLIKPATWWRATLVGALQAYVLGYLPSTILSLEEQASQTQSTLAEPEQWMVLLLAAGLGAVGGLVLSFTQWFVLRHWVDHAAMWLPANMLAWLVGIPIIFWGIDQAQRLAGIVWIILIVAGVLLLTGMVVGAIHGVFLVKLVKFKSTTT